MEKTAAELCIVCYKQRDSRVYKKKGIVEDGT